MDTSQDDICPGDDEMSNKPLIDHRVDEKIDEKIDAAQLPPIKSLDTAENIASKTTAEQDLRTAGQRKTNLIWEGTQAFVALSITAATIYAVLNGVESILLGNAFTLIIALYFVRTNHTKIGGVGGTDSR